MYLSFGGCINLSPKYERNELPVPLSIIEGNEAVGILDLPEWEQFYIDPYLIELIALALEHNRDLKIALASVDQMKALHQLSKSHAQPNVSSSFTVSQDQGDAGGVDYSSWSYGQSLLNMTAFEIDFWGRLKKLKEVALANYHASLAVRNTVSISIINGTAETYYLYLNAKRRLQLHERTVKVYQELLELVEKRKDAGVATASDVARIRADLAKVQVAEAQIEKDIDLYFSALQLIVGIDRTIRDCLPKDNGEVRREIHFLLPDAISSHVLLNRPDIIEAEYRLIASHADIGVARAAFLPKVSLSGSLNTNSSSLSDLFKSHNSNITLTLVNTIFGHGQKANLRYVKAKRKELLARYEKAIQTAFSEVFTQIKLCDAYQKELDANNMRVAAQKEHFAYVEARYEAEISSYSDILSALEDLVEAEHAQLISERNQLLGRIQLYKALGGGIQAGQNRSYHFPKRKFDFFGI